MYFFPQLSLCKTLPQILLITPGQKKTAHFLPDSVSLKIYPLQQKLWKEKTMMLDKYRLICYFYGCLATQKNQFHTSIHSWNIYSGILQSDLSRASWVITQNLEFGLKPVMEFGMGSESSQWFFFQAVFSEIK